LPEVQEHFEHTLHAQEKMWGGDEEGMLENFGPDPGIKIKIVYEGADEGPVLLKERMKRPGHATLFYMWNPSALLKQFNLSRVSLPEYNKAGFLAGLSDYPLDVIDKVTSWTFSSYAPEVDDLFSRFTLDNDAQTEMLADLDNQKSNVRQIACGWMLRNNATWTSWFPKDEFKCDVGTFIILMGREKLCGSCEPGYFSQPEGGTVTACQACAPGMVSFALCWFHAGPRFSHASSH
jgi:ABC-type proline/glycine betaine transport system substrate-binding protein